MTFQSPGAIFLTLGPFTIRWYGVLIALAFLACVFAANRLARKLDVSPDRVLNLALICFIGGIIGARLYFCWLKWDDFAAHPLEIFATWKGGLSIHGGILGALIVGGIYCKEARLSFPVCADILSTASALGQSIGRWGNFFNCELFGYPVAANFPIKLFIPAADRPLRFQSSSYFHPTFLYESVFDLALFFFLYFYAVPRLKVLPGATFLLYLALYSVGRIAIESIRSDGITYAGIPVPIIASFVSIGIAAAGMAILLIRHRNA